MPITRDFEAETGLLHPALPALLVGTSRHRGPITVRPRASLDNASPQPPRNASGQGASTSQPVKFSIPTPIRYGLGGGAAYLMGAKLTGRWPFRRGKTPAPAPPNKVPRILILMSLTGGGHKASAEAIQAAFQELFGNKYEVLVVDLWTHHTPWPFNKWPESYSFLVKNSLLWRLSYTLMQPRVFHVPYLAAMGLFISEGLNQGFDQYNPDMVVSVHPLMQHVCLNVLKHRIQSGAQRPLNYATVVTDFTTCHNAWFHTDATRCFVPTQYCADLGRGMGLQEEQIVLYGLPIRPVFSKPLPPKKALRKKLGLLTDVPAALLIGGGEGMGQLEDTVKELAACMGAACQVVVICGRNKELLSRLRSTQYSGTAPGSGTMNVLALGFMDNIHEWMGACDLVITKAGPGTIAEALISGLPILLNGNVPCQEEGNIPYVVDNQVGAFETRPKYIAQIVRDWLSPANAKEFEAMGRRSKELGRPEAVYQIARDLAALTDKLDFTFGPARWAPAKVREALAMA